MKVKTVLLAASLFVTPNFVFAGSVAGTGGALESTQWLNYGELALQYAKQVQQAETQLNNLTQSIQHTEMMAKNLVQLPAATWSKFENDVLALKNVVQQGQAVSFAAANLDSQFAQVFKGYSNYEASAAGSLDARTTTFAQQYKNINQSTRDSTNGALKALNTQMSAMSSDESVMDMLQQQSRSADGELKAVQAANEIAMHQTDTLKKLQYTLMVQASTQAAYQAAQNDKETAKDALSARRNVYTMPNINRTATPSAYEHFPH